MPIYERLSKQCILNDLESKLLFFEVFWKSRIVPEMLDESFYSGGNDVLRKGFENCMYDMIMCLEWN